MPVYDITAPDGRTFEVTAPEGATEADVLAYAQANAPAKPETFSPAEGMSGSDKFFAAMGRGVNEQKQGLLQMIPGMVSQSDLQQTDRRDAPLMDSWQGKAGSFAGKMAAPIVAAMTLPGTATVAGAAALGGLLGLAEPVKQGSVAKGKAINAGTSALFAAGGQKVGNLIGDKLAARASTRAAQKVADATKNTTTKAGQGLGYVVPPTHANPTATNRVLEGLAGKLTTGQQAATKNQAVTDLVAKRALGIPDNVPLTVDAVDAVRKAAGDSYKVLKGFGRNFATDAQYVDDLVRITDNNGALAREFPEIASKNIDDFVTGFAKSDFSPSGAIEAIKKLRSDAKILFRADSPDKVAMARASIGVADAMENAIERDLQRTGEEGILSAYRAARELIAKTHTVRNAMSEGSGHVIARKLAGELSKGKPLSGDMRTAAQFAQVYPKATQEVTSSMPGISPLDFYGGGAASAASGSLLPMAIPAGRMMARGGLLSPAYQRVMTTPNYAAGGVEQLINGLLGTPAAGMLAASPLIYGHQ